MANANTNTDANYWNATLRPQNFADLKFFSLKSEQLPTGLQSSTFSIVIQTAFLLFLFFIAMECNNSKPFKRKDVEKLFERPSKKRGNPTYQVTWPMKNFISAFPQPICPSNLSGWCLRAGGSHPFFVDVYWLFIS